MDRRNFIKGALVVGISAPVVLPVIAKTITKQPLTTNTGGKGEIISFYDAGAAEGIIFISGTTASYNRIKKLPE